MRWAKILFAVLALVAAACADRPDTVLLPCGEGTPGAPNCNPSKAELKQAKSAYVKGLKLEKDKKTQAAYEQLDKAAELAPRNIEYITARELLRQQLVSDHMQRGNKALLTGNQATAIADFREALHLDPDNQFAQERLQDAIGRTAPTTAEHPRVLKDAGEVRTDPNNNLASFHFRGDTKDLLGSVASVYGLTAIIDDSLMSRHVRFDLGEADFYAAMGAACAVAHCFWSPVSAREIIIAADNPENRRRFERMVLRTFYIPGATTPQELNEIVSLLRAVFEIRFVTVQQTGGIIEVRAPQATMDAATKVLEGLDNKRPQILLDVNVYEVSHSVMRSFGLHIPNQFNLFNIPAAALVALGGQNVQDLINQLISGGGINQAGSQAVSALLAQLGSQQNSIFSQPLATFGGGLSLFGLSLDVASISASLNQSSVKSLEHATMRVSQGNEGSLHIGTRYPILNASFAPVFNTPQISSVIQNNSFAAAFPSFNYEDLGLTIKTKPLVTSGQSVSLDVDMQVRTLGTASLNGVPVISNREYKGSINLADGEPAVVAGSVSTSEQRSLSGIPGFGQVPLLNKISASNTVQNSDDELLVVITPQVISAPQSESFAVWMPK
jgi:general secretion pathway protein D